MKPKNFFVLILLLVLFFISYNTFSYPRFAVYRGEKCESCHLNPTGAGLRNAYGIKYSKDNLYMKFMEKVNKEAEFSTQLTKTIQVGGDMRVVWINNETGEGNPNFNSFFQMQGDLYVNAKLNKYLNVVINPGFFIPNTFSPSPLSTKSEIYGMISKLPAGLFVKAGRFIPNFGLKLPEHRAYNRIYNDLYTPYAADAGIEIGISPSFFTLTASLTNGTSKDINGTTNNSFDFDNQKQVTVTGDFRWASKKNKYTFGAGGSYIHNPFKYDYTNNINAIRQISAGFISIGIMERVALLAEYDYNRTQLRDSLSTKSDFSTIFAEISVRLVKGIELRTQAEFIDRDLGIKKGSGEMRRYSFGLAFFPMTGLEVEGMFRYVDEPGVLNSGTGDTEIDIKNNEYQLNFKFYF